MKISLSHIMLGLASLTLSSSIWALGMNNWNEQWDNVWGTATMDNMYDPDYRVVDKTTHAVEYLDGVEQGKAVPDAGAMKHQYDGLVGDEITDLRTQRSGIITGVKEQGTMDVMTASGKTVRYQYVTFSVKPVK